MANVIKIDDRELKKAVEKLSQFPKQMPKATSSAINRTITFANKRLKQEVRKEYSIKNEDIQKTIEIKKANPSMLSASIKSSDRRLTLQRFSKNLGVWKKGKLIKVKVKKSGAKKLNTTPKAFALTLNGNIHVAKREGKKQYPIKVLRTLSIPQMISNKKIAQIVQQETQEKLKERIEHEVNYRLSKLR